MASREQEIIDTALIMSEAAAFKAENARLQEQVDTATTTGLRVMKDLKVALDWSVRLQERVEEAEAAVEKEGIVIYNGLSVPKRELDEVQAEHASRIADLVAERDRYKAHMGEAWQEYRRLRYLRRRLRWAEEESDRYKALAEEWQGEAMLWEGNAAKAEAMEHIKRLEITVGLQEEEEACSACKAIHYLHPNAAGVARD